MKVIWLALIIGIAVAIAIVGVGLAISVSDKQIDQMATTGGPEDRHIEIELKESVVVGDKQPP